MRTEQKRFPALGHKPDSGHGVHACTLLPLTATFASSSPYDDDGNIVISRPSDLASNPDVHRLDSRLSLCCLSAVFLVTLAPLLLPTAAMIHFLDHIVVQLLGEGGAFNADPSLDS